MTHVERRLLTHHAVEAAVIEIVVACPGTEAVDAAAGITRDAALYMRAHIGSEKTAEALYRLADEIVGAG